MLEALADPRVPRLLAGDYEFKGRRPVTDSLLKDQIVPFLVGIRGDVGHHVFDVGVFLEGVGRHVLAEAGLYSSRRAASP